MTKLSKWRMLSSYSFKSANNNVVDQTTHTHTHRLVCAWPLLCPRATKAGFLATRPKYCIFGNVINRVYWSFHLKYGIYKPREVVHVNPIKKRVRLRMSFFIGLTTSRDLENPIFHMERFNKLYVWTACSNEENTAVCDVAKLAGSWHVYLQHE